MAKKSAGVSIEEELLEEVDSRLEYGDSRSEWIEGAIELRLQIEDWSKERR